MSGGRYTQWLRSKWVPWVIGAGIVVKAALVIAVAVGAMNHATAPSAPSSASSAAPSQAATH